MSTAITQSTQKEMAALIVTAIKKFGGRWQNGDGLFNTAGFQLAAKERYDIADMCGLLTPAWAQRALRADPFVERIGDAHWKADVPRIIAVLLDTTADNVRWNDAKSYWEEYAAGGHWVGIDDEELNGREATNAR